MELNRPEISHEIKGSRTDVSTGPTKTVPPPLYFHWKVDSAVCFGL